MNRITKMLAAACAVMSLGTSLFAQTASKAVPGAVLYVYSLKGDAVRPLPDAEPIAVVVDNCKAFARKNVKKDAETEKFLRQNVCLIWKGFVSIPAKGYYTFSMSYDQTNYGRYSATTTLQINGKDFLGIEKGKRNDKCNDSRTLLLEQGEYEFTIAHDGDVDFGDFSVRMWNKANPLKKVAITPSSMVHAE